MSNIWEHPTIIATEAMRHLEDGLVVVNKCAVDKTSEFTTRANGWKVGDTASFRTHGEYTVDEFSSTIDTQDITTSTRSLTIEKHFDTSIEVTSKEEALDLDSLSDQVIKPVMYKFAEKIDTYVGTKIMQAAGLYVSDGLFANAADIALARKAAMIQQLNREGRFCLVDYDLEATLLGQSWFNQAQTRGAEGLYSLTSGEMGRVMGMDFSSSIAFPTTDFTAGTMICATNNTTGTKNIIGDTTLTVDTQTASKAVKAGDRLAIAGVRRPLIVKTAIADTDATTAIALVDPITEVIPDNAAVTVIGSGQDLTFKACIFDDRSMAVGFPMLEKPAGVWAGVANSQGLNLRIVRDYNISTKVSTLSVDMLAGSFALDPRRMTLCAEY